VGWAASRACYEGVARAVSRVLFHVPMPFTQIAEIPCRPERSSVYEHGWQSWSPAGRYPATSTSPRPARPLWQTMAFRPERPAPQEGFQGEGLLAVETDESAVLLFAAPDPWREVPSIRVTARGDRLLVAADGEVAAVEGERLTDLLATWADGAAAAAGHGPVPSIPPAWCSWYCYWTGVREEDVLANVEAADRLDLPIATIQIDDGHQAEIGDWLERSGRFGPLDVLADRIIGTGRSAGIWTAPFLVGARSRIAAEHPEWLVEGAVASQRHWDQEIRVLDVTHPAAAEHLHEVFATLRAQGFTYHKIDFLYAGAMEGGRHSDCSPLEAYAEGLRIVREGIGDDAFLLGCGAPLLPSIGRVDAMRVSPDIDPKVEPPDGDISQPSQRGAVAAGRARAWMHGRLWVNDLDCIVARPEIEERDVWAAHLRALGGMAVSSDPLDALDEHGLALTRELLQASSPDPVAEDPLDAPVT
jgi:alpha-galactosidase